MTNVNENETVLDVPYYQQTHTATCGPACLMMVMKYWNPLVELSRKLEFQLWKKSYSLFLFGGTFQFGLASAVAQLGFKTEIFQKTPFSDNYPKFPQLVKLIENIVSYRARRLHIPVQYGQENLRVISNALSQSKPPIVFVNLYHLLGENVFHWIVVTGCDEKNVYVNDPYVPSGFKLKQKKNYPIPIDKLCKAMTTETGRNLRLPPCIVLVNK